MNMRYLPSLTINDGLSLIEAFDMARTTAVVLAAPEEPAHSPSPVYRYGSLEFNSMEQALEELRLCAFGSRTNPVGIVGQRFVTLMFNTEAEYQRMTARLHGPVDAATSDFMIQVRGKSDIWHQMIHDRHLVHINKNLIEAGKEPIRLVKSPEEGSRDAVYYFPTLAAMNAFNFVMGNPRLNTAAFKAEQAAGLHPRAT